MRALDDILFGFLIFFSIDRLIRLLSNLVLEPFLEKKKKDPDAIDNWKLAFELILLIAACFIVYIFRKQLASLVT